MACNMPVPGATHSLTGWHRRVPVPLRSTRNVRVVVVRALTGNEQQQLSQAAAPATAPAARRSGPPLWIVVPGLLLAVAGGARAVKAYLRKQKGSMGELESRGYLDEERGNKDPYLSDAMKNVNTINYEPLSKDQIEAARKRRLRERDQEDLDIEKVELPENHPWAVKQQVSKDEEELQKARLTIRRGAPLQDLSGKRGFPEDPRARSPASPPEQALR